MKAYKGFRADLTCDPTGSAPYQYEEGCTYETDVAVPCESGFHACPMPLGVPQYYSPAKSSAYHEVEVDDDAAVRGDKVASKHLRVGARLTIAGLVKAQIGLVWDRASKEGPSSGDGSTAASSGYGSTAASSGDGSTAASSGYGSTAASSGDGSTAASSGTRSTSATSGDGSTSATSGDGSTAATSGYGSTAASSGDCSTSATSGYGSTAATSGTRSTAASSGDCSTSATSGYGSTSATSGDGSTAATSGTRSTSATSGDYSTAAVTGAESVAVAAGRSCTASGAEGCWLVLVERDTTWRILDVKAVKVEGDILPGVAYQLVDGQVVQA